MGILIDDPRISEFVARADDMSENLSKDMLNEIV
jgi:hypothetical protein